MQESNVTYDADLDALYVRLRAGKVKRTKALDDLRLVDLAADDSIIGVEFLSASGGLDLSGLPREEMEERLGRGELHFPIFA